MNTLMINCVPGYRASWDTLAASHKHVLTVGVYRPLRERLTADRGVVRVPAPIADVPLSPSASSSERNP